MKSYYKLQVFKTMIKCKHQSRYKFQFIKTKQACRSKTNYKKMSE